MRDPHDSLTLTLPPVRSHERGLASFRGYEYVQLRDVIVQAMRKGVDAYDAGDVPGLELQLEIGRQALKRMDHMEAV